MKPCVSILIPIYKVPENYLRRCIESATSQTLRNIEIILVDDGSPDNCGRICDEYAIKDPRIKVIHKPNGGLAAARNSAFDAAVGEYITFLDGDDFLETNACERAFETAKEQNVQMVFWNQCTEYSNRTEKIETMGKKPIRFSSKGCRDLQVRVLDFNGKIAQVFSKLIRREFLQDNNIRHVDHLSQGAEGFVFNIQLFNYLESAYYLPEYLLHYVYNENSITHTPNENNYYQIIKCFEYVENYIKNCERQNELEEMLLNRILYVIVTTGISGYFNPFNLEKYSEKKRKFKLFLNQDLIKKSLQESTREGLNRQRKIVVYLVEHNCFWGLSVLGAMRQIQLRRK
ncbi:MAG: glycosyltransferase [Lachnospiraceae bacterium]|nr:glycosyltransferase [Lachnospiraceae bacterium]